jgi:hypothetical protein
VGDRVVVVGLQRDGKLGMVPASWSSTDGRTWVRSRAPVTDSAFSFDAATVVGNTIVAIGSSHLGIEQQTAGSTPATPPSLPSLHVWLSSDGIS